MPRVEIREELPRHEVIDYAPLIYVSVLNGLAQDRQLRPDQIGGLHKLIKQQKEALTQARENRWPLVALNSAYAAQRIGTPLAHADIIGDRTPRTITQEPTDSFQDFIFDDQVLRILTRHRGRIGYEQDGRIIFLYYGASPPPEST